MNRTTILVPVTKTRFRFEESTNTVLRYYTLQLGQFKICFNSDKEKRNLSDAKEFVEKRITIRLWVLLSNA